MSANPDPSLTEPTDGTRVDSDEPTAANRTPAEATTNWAATEAAGGTNAADAGGTETAPEVATELATEVATAEGAPFLVVVFTTFTTVFLAELGDKTQLAALLLSAQSGHPVLVFIGAALALICSSLVGVLLGRWLASVLPQQRLERISGLLMVALGLWLGGQAVVGLLTP
jgi:putative Ca2+/H+ antiporter (TMEM165/GDT1 family)